MNWSPWMYLLNFIFVQYGLDQREQYSDVHLAANKVLIFLFPQSVSVGTSTF